MSQGAPKDKLILGVPFYGRGFTLQDANSHGVGAPITGDNTALAYSQLCVQLKQGGWTDVYDDQGRVPYAYKGKQWLSYDNVK